MALNVPTVGSNVILEVIVNKTAAQNLVAKLYINNITPADTDTAATYTEAGFPGYSAITLTGAAWNAASAESISYGSQQTWTCSGTSTDDVYGYFIIQTTSGILMWSERDASAPFAVRVSGDAVKLTPTITAE